MPCTYGHADNVVYLWISANNLLRMQTQATGPRGKKDRDLHSYSVRLCTSIECLRTLWNRDVNAAINILKLFLIWASGLPHPSEFRRA